MFHRFADENERRLYGGSDFIELQYCRLKEGTPVQTIVSVSTVVHWQDDSIYVHGEDLPVFLSNYGEIFANGLYNNMTRGKIDPCGINYYPPSEISRIIGAVEKIRPAGYATISDWLKKALLYNGVYILGM
ncbi:MAG: hypothetical protein GXX89_03455 [Clostridiales bacterium]|jgi:hypothetical protein|nr:hypothetical protein [Clostridiales bacterium]